MIFEEWMHSKGLSEYSASRYAAAVSGVLTEWAVANRLFEGSLASITSKIQFASISLRIRELPIFSGHNMRGHGMYSSALVKYAEYLADVHTNHIESDIEYIIADPTTDITEKNTLVKSRIGQGVFREKLIAYWTCCSVTGFKDTDLLIASHIKPWHVSNNAERLDVCNGLLLVPNLDRAFDAGLITFEESGKIKISPQFAESEKLGVMPDLRVSLTPKHDAYMKFHRTEVYRAT